MSKECLVTGGAGFIGSNLIDRLVDMGYHVICMDNFDPYYDIERKRRNIEHHLKNENFRLTQGNILDPEVLKQIIQDEGVDYIFHNAAQCGVRVSVQNPEKTHEVNVNGTFNVLMAAMDSDVTKIINTSSSSVYGEVQYLPFDEKHPKLPVSPYGVSKLAAEEYCRIFYKIYGLKTTTIRPFTVYGPRMRPDLAISIFTRKALNNEDIEIFGDGKQTRDFSYISDVVDANIKAMKKGDGEVYNIGTGKRYTINEVAGKIIKITKSKSKIVHVEGRKGEARHTMADISKPKKELGWVPKVQLVEGIKEFIKWYSRNYNVTKEFK